ncbi:hypothetical protein [Peribacillus frigoritolerans]|uniref:hypothetical protein n=1 Tax=Peribacillus frigoritolerans TaxID=450367 RepID=UPI00363A4312
MTIKSLLTEQWNNHYNKALNELLNNESLSSDKKTEGINFLNFVGNNMKGELLEEFENIAETFVMRESAEVTLNHLNSLSGKSHYELQSHMLGNGNFEGIIKKIDNYSQIEFDPHVLEETMLCEYTIKKGDWYLTLHMYEIWPFELRFTAFEY